MGRLLVKIFACCFLLFVISGLTAIYALLKTTAPIEVASWLVNKSPDTRLTWTSASGNITEGFTLKGFSLKTPQEEINFGTLSLKYEKGKGNYLQEFIFSEALAENGSIFTKASLKSGASSGEKPTKKQTPHASSSAQKDRSILFKKISIKNVVFGSIKGGAKSVNFFKIEKFLVNEALIKKQAGAMNGSVAEIDISTSHGDLLTKGLESSFSPDGQIKISMAEAAKGTLKQKLWSGLKQDIPFSLTASYQGSNFDLKLDIMEGQILSNYTPESGFKLQASRLHLAKFMMQSPMSAISFDYQFSKPMEVMMKQPSSFSFQLDEATIAMDTTTDAGRTPASAPPTDPMAQLAALSKPIPFAAQTQRGVLKLEGPGSIMGWMMYFAPGVPQIGILKVVESPESDELETISQLFFGKKDRELNEEEKSRAALWKTRFDFRSTKFAPAKRAPLRLR